MATAGALCTTIIGDLGRNDTSLSDLVLIDIQSAIRGYEGERFFFNEQLISLTLSATDTYALSLFATAGTCADIIEVDGMSVAISTTRNYDMQQISYDQMSSRRNNGANGNPTHYAIFNRSVFVDPKPTTALTVTMAAHIKATEIAAGGFSTSNVWTTEASELTRNAALKRFYARRQKDMDSANAVALLETDEYNRLKRRTDALTDSIDGYL